MTTQYLSVILQQNMKKEIKKMTICFLIRKINNKGDEVCLGKKKRGYRVGKLNGSGGKIEYKESPIKCAIRETKEEFSVNLEYVEYKGEVIYEDFNLIHHCYIYVSNKWIGNPTETEEMIPKWYQFNNIPFNQMGETDHLWIPEVLKGHIVNAKFCFDKDEKLIYKKVDFQTISTPSNSSGSRGYRSENSVLNSE